MEDHFHDQRVIQDQTVNHHVVNHLDLEVQWKNQQAEVLKEVAVKVVAVVTVMTKIDEKNKAKILCKRFFFVLNFWFNGSYCNVGFFLILFRLLTNNLKHNYFICGEI